MKTIVCSCGGTKTVNELYANVVFVRCADCNEVITQSSECRISFAHFVYSNNRKAIRARFGENKEIVKFALKIKDAQEEEEYKLKMISQSSTATSTAFEGN